jgi:hypothetical protein
MIYRPPRTCVFDPSYLSIWLIIQVYKQDPVKDKWPYLTSFTPHPPLRLASYLGHERPSLTVSSHNRKRGYSYLCVVRTILHLAEWPPPPVRAGAQSTVGFHVPATTAACGLAWQDAHRHRGSPQRLPPLAANPYLKV